MTSPGNNQFSSEYSDYWRKLTQEVPSVSGVPDSEIASTVIATLLEGHGYKFNPTLDAACGSGRLFQVLSAFSDDIDGVEMEATAAETARLSPYTNVYTRALEDFTTERKYGLIVCWAAFEVLKQKDALAVFANSLASEGMLIITAKSADYPLSDLQAISAEAGAAKKGFNQFFVDTRVFSEALPDYGLEIVRTVTFEKRGDFARASFEVFNRGIPDESFYEFAISLQKIGENANPDSLSSWSLPVSRSFRLHQKSLGR